MNFRKLLILPLLVLTVIGVASNLDFRRKPKKDKKKKKPKTERAKAAYTRKPAMPTKTAVFEPYRYSASADPYGQSSYPWTDSVMNSLTPQERIGQLFMVSAYSNGDEKHFKKIDSLVTQYGIGGLIFMQGGPVRQASLTNRWQQMARVPLLLSMDAEWGLAMRLDSVIRFPKQMTMGALPSDSLVYQVGKEIALQFKRIGMQVNFGPVADVNNNPANPVINMRSFGENKELVTQRAIAYMRGMQDEHVMGTAKHFPGHGDTDADSHLALPVINQTRGRLDSLELYPFKKLFNAGIGSVMVAHLFVPVLDTTTNQATSLSPKVVTDLLKNEMKFKGLIFTDALNMKGVASFYTPGKVDLKALIAGNDMLLIPEDVPTAMMLIDSALMTGEITQFQIDEHCRKILQAKEWSGLNRISKVSYANLVNDLSSPNAVRITRQIKRQALTLIKNEKDVLPLTPGKTVAIVAVGDAKPDQFQQTLSNYVPAAFFNTDKTPTTAQIKALKDTLKYYDQVVLAIVNTNILAKKNFGFTEEGITLCNTIARQNKTILAGFVNPYALLKLENLDNYQAIIVGYQDDEETNIEAAQLIAGAITASGKLPVSINEKINFGTGMNIETNEKLGYADPEEVGMDATKLARVDSIVKAGMNKEAYPGCQVLVARKGKIIYQKGFGTFTYKTKEDPTPIAVKDNSIYDLASLTKVLSTTISIMKLVDEGKIDINKTLGYYIPFIPKGSPHANVTVRDAMLHQAGFIPFIPFYKSFITNDTVRNENFTLIPDSAHSWKVADVMHNSPSLKDSIFKAIFASKVNPAQGYKYSDIGFIYMREVVEQVSKKPIEEYVAETFYTPMGLTTMGYQPLKRFDRSRIAPTEYDLEFRKQLVHGYVHDPGAALMNGVSGHAGLFANSYDVAVIMQMLLNGGEYNGVQYIDEAVVKQFTQTFEPAKSRRALGFDKPTRDGSNGPTFNGISFESFGHSGFTGTFTWADPKEEIVYVFLSNRVYPSAENNKLVKMSIRSDVQEAIYKAIR